MHSLLADLSPSVCSRAYLISLRCADRWPWGMKGQTFPEDKAWLYLKTAAADVSKSAQGHVDIGIPAWAPASPAHSPTPFSMPFPLPWTGKMVFETLVHHHPRLLAFQGKESFLSQNDLSFECWFLDSKHPSLSSELVLCRGTENKARGKGL